MGATIKRGDFGSPVRGVLTDAATGDRVDIAGADVRFVLRLRGSSEPFLYELASNDQDLEDESTNGNVSYTWQEGDTDTPGIYKLEWEVTYSGGEVQTFPSDGYNLIAITPDLGELAS